MRSLQLLFFAVLSVFFHVGVVFGQTLQEMNVVPQQSDRVFVFRDYEDYAALYIESSIPNLQISSNLRIVADLSEPNTGIYRVIVEPSRQQIYFAAQRFLRVNYPTGNLRPRDVIYLKIEPKENIVTEVGTLLVRTEPSGARLTIQGVPGEFTSPHTFPNLLAQTYTIRVEKEDYVTEEKQIRVNSERPNVETFILTPTVGYISLNVPDAQLFLATDAFPEEYRVSFTPNVPVKLDVGTYRYRINRRFYQEATGVFEVLPGVSSVLNPQLNPDFATLRVRSNVRNMRIVAPDNNAPSSADASVLYLERGIRQVRFEASGYETQTMTFRVEAGAVIDTTITLITIAEAQRRRQRESLPQGILTLASDVDAEIFINGELRGTQEVSVSLIPDTYRVEMRHALGTKRFSVNVPSADVLERYEIFRPSKGRAMTYATLVPGGGHFYTKRSRGYLYLGLAGAAAGYAVYNLQERNALQGDLDGIMASYQAANTVADAERFRAEAESVFNQKQSAHNQFIMGLAAFAGVYAIQWIDVAITLPEFGYRSNTPMRFQAGTTGNGVKLTYRF